MQINTDVYPEVGYDSYSRWTNETIDYSASQPLEHSIFYAGTISENVQFCDENNYSYIAQAPNCAFTVTPREIVKGDIFFIKGGYRHFNFNGEWVYYNSADYNIVTEFDISQFYFDLDKLTVHVYDTSQPDGGHDIGRVISMPFTEYRNKSAEYKATHLIRDCLHNWGTGQGDSFLKYKNVANYADVNVVPMIRYVFNDKTTLYLPFGMLTNYANLPWQGPLNLDSFTGFGKFGYQLTDIYLPQYPGIGKWSEGWTPGDAAHAVTMANCGSVDSLIIHAGSAGQQVQQIINGYQMPDLATIDTDKYAVPVFLWGNRWDKRLEAFYTDEYIMRYFASSGLRFKVDDVMYIGYMDANGQCNGDYLLESELADSDSANKDITDFTGSAYDADVPYVPPTPPTPEEDPRDASIYGTYSGGAGVFARCWYCNQDALNSLWLWAGGSDDPDVPQPPEGFSPINSIIGLQLFPVNIPIPEGTAKTAIVFFNAIAEGDRTVNTHVSDDVYLGTGKTFEIDLGSVTVDEHHANDWAYLDYDETVELYIPFCGVYSIDTQTVMGKTITAKLYVDPVAGTCTFIATCDNVDVAMGSGSMAVSLPVTANQYSMTLAAINTNRAAARNAAISSATVGAAQVGASFASGYSNGYRGAENQMLSVAGSYDDLADIYGAGNPVKIARGAGIRSGLSNAFTSISNGFTSASIGGLINSALNTRRANKILASSNNTAVSGSFGGSQDTWRLPMQAYIKTIRYLTKIPTNHVDVIGKIFLQETTLANCSGYTTVANPNLSSLTGFLTTAELTELYGILLNGIYAGGGAE